jgi:hypothetical protein
MRARACLLVVVLAAAGLGGCFSPRQPGCAFSCAGDQLCPENYVCASDGFCHRNDGLGACTLEATEDAADGAPDAATAQDGQVD